MIQSTMIFLLAIVRASAEDYCIQHLKKYLLVYPEDATQCNSEAATCTLEQAKAHCDTLTSCKGVTETKDGVATVRATDTLQNSQTEEITYLKTDSCVVPEENHYRQDSGVGNWGGTCTCPDGQVYNVGDLSGSYCSALACEGGTSSACISSDQDGAGWKVTCAAAPTESPTESPTETPTTSTESNGTSFNGTSSETNGTSFNGTSFGGPCDDQCPEGTCDSEADSQKAECQDCVACHQMLQNCWAGDRPRCPQDPCANDDDGTLEACADCRACMHENSRCGSVCPVGTCDSEADIDKPECADCAACHMGNTTSNTTTGESTNTTGESTTTTGESTTTTGESTNTTGESTTTTGESTTTTTTGESTTTTGESTTTTTTTGTSTTTGTTGTTTTTTTTTTSGSNSTGSSEDVNFSGASGLIPAVSAMMLIWFV